MKMDIGEIGWKVVDWILLVHDRDHSNEPSDSIRGTEFLEMSRPLASLEGPCS
jgi:hypothetical protein